MCLRNYSFSASFVKMQSGPLHHSKKFYWMAKKVHSLALTLPSLPSCLKDNFSFTMRECTLDFACEGDLVLQIKKYLVIPVFKDPLSNLIDLFLKTCLALS